MKNIENADFVIKPPEMFKTSMDYVKAELESDISVFSEDAQPLLKKYVLNKELDKNEYSLLYKEINEWWYDKYGFPFTNKTARHDTLMRKYASSKDMQDVLDLQKKMLSAIKNGDEHLINNLRVEYAEKYPEQIEGVMSLLDLYRYLKSADKIKNCRKKSNELGKTKKMLNKKEGGVYPQIDDEINKVNKDKLKLIKDQTEYQFILTHFISNNGQNKEFLRTFWEVMEQVAKNNNNFKQFNQMRQGVLSQVSALKIFQALNAKPKLSHPREDAFSAIDMWSDEEEGEALQIKSTKYLDEPAIYETDQISFPSVVTENEKDKKYFNTKYQRELNGFRAKLDKLQSNEKKEIKGHLLVIPASKFDFITGEPTEDMIEFVRKHLESVERDDRNKEVEEIVLG